MIYTVRGSQRFSYLLREKKPNKFQRCFVINIHLPPRYICDLSTVFFLVRVRIHVSHGLQPSRSLHGKYKDATCQAHNRPGITATIMLM
jgi:hypothetical protein